MKCLNAENIIKNQVDTINQYKVLQYLKENLNIVYFNVYLYDDSTIKIIDSNNEVGYFRYNALQKTVEFFEEIEYSNDKEITL